MSIGELDSMDSVFLNYLWQLLLYLDIEMFYQLYSEVHIAQDRNFNSFFPVLSYDLVIK